MEYTIKNINEKIPYIDGLINMNLINIINDKYIENNILKDSEYGNGISIVIIDTGIDSTHDDLKKIEIDHYIFDDSNNIINEHGTHVAGIISNICKKSKLIDLKILDINGICYEKKLLKALNWCVENHKNIDIINMSIGWENYSSEINKLIDKLDRLGIIIISASGNNFKYSNNLPMNAISVGAIDPVTNKIASFTNTKNKIDIFAPGVNILSCIPSNTYKLSSGTSMAVPHVTGLCSLLSAKFNKNNLMFKDYKSYKNNRKKYIKHVLLKYHVRYNDNSYYGILDCNIQYKNNNNKLLKSLLFGLSISKKYENIILFFTTILIFIIYFMFF